MGLTGGITDMADRMMGSAEQERAAIVAWLRDRSLDAHKAFDTTGISHLRTQADAISLAATIVELGGHLQHTSGKGI